MNASEPLFSFEGDLEFLHDRFDWSGYGDEPELLPNALYVQDGIGSELIATLQIEWIDSEQGRHLDGQRVRVTVETI